MSDRELNRKAILDMLVIFMYLDLTYNMYVQMDMYWRDYEHN